MSTAISKIKGRIESKESKSFKPKYEDATLNITRFYGGKKEGRMLQLTISGQFEDGYIQLTQKKVKKLAEILNNSFNNEIYPSE